MNNIQILTIAIALGTSFLAVLTGVLLNNTRLNEVKELLRAEIRAAHAEMRAEFAEVRGEFAELRAEMRAQHSDLLGKFAELDTRLTRIENERRIVQ